MNGQEKRTCRVVAFVSIDRSAFVYSMGSVVEESRLRGASTNGERGAKGRREGSGRGRRSPLTSRQSGAAKVSMTPVRGHDRQMLRDASRTVKRGIIIMVFRAIQSENTISDRFLR